MKYKEQAGLCLFCKEWVTDKREESGSKIVNWATGNGDFGCNANPISDPENGVGPHVRPSNKWLITGQLQEEGK